MNKATCGRCGVVKLVTWGVLICGVCRPAAAEQTFNENLRIKTLVPILTFENTSTVGGTDWSLFAQSSPTVFFGLTDINFGTVPFRVDQGLPGNALRVSKDTSGEANLGIGGVAANAFHLHLRSKTSGGARIRMEDTGAGPNGGGSDIFSNGTLFSISAPAIGGGASAFRMNAGARSNSLVLDSTGNVGMGTLAPVQTLHLLEAAKAPALRFQDASSSPQTWDIKADHLGFSLIDLGNVNTPDLVITPFTVLPDAPTASLFVATNGNVGLGTSLPNRINGVDPGGVARHLNLNAGSGIARSIVQGNTAAESFLVQTGGAANQKIVRTRVTNGLYFLSTVPDTAVGSIEPFVFSVNLSTANVGIKTGAPTFPLQVGDAGANDGNGAHVTTGGVWTDASSRSVKQDIQPLTSAQARDTVRALRPVGYRYKNEPDEQYVGFIAEDVPELVATNDRKSLAPMDIVAVLTKVVQDQDRQLDEQRAINQALMERLAKLEQKRGDRDPAATRSDSSTHAR